MGCDNCFDKQRNIGQLSCQYYAQSLTNSGERPHSVIMR